MFRKPAFDSFLATAAHALCIPFALAALLSSSPAHAGDNFVKPTPEELAMTSLPGYPGVPAVVLFKEEITKDDLHSIQHYNRIKILSEEGKKYANVELGYYSTSGWDVAIADDKTIEEISGRTIHPDGTIIPFTGKPYLKVLEKAGGVKLQEKVFTLPDVEVGSIIEYRYFTRISDNVVESPTWQIQGELPVKEAHFVWWPTTHRILDEDEREITTISWFPILPEGAKIQSRELPPIGQNNAARVYELTVKDVPPTVEEEFMPPLGSYTYSVRFNFTPYRTQAEFWTAVGKRWSKRINSFASTNDALNQATQKAIAGTTTDEDKLRNIYGLVMGLENTRYTRQRDTREDKAAGIKKISNASDILERGRGTPTELTELFIAMARSAGMHAYAMYVPDRSEQIFTPYWMNLDQFSDVLAIVNVDGKERFFDPGSRYCPFGDLAWQHTFVQGIRQVDGGTAIANSGGDSYKSNRTTRVANLTMDSEGQVTGKVDITFSGAPALRWRQAALRGDDEGLRKELREAAERMLPRTLDVEVADIKDTAAYSKPLLVTYKVKGTLGTSMGKRMMIPADIFLANQPATFPHDKRETAVYFHYPEAIQDAVRVNLPQQLAVEAAPNSTRYSLPNLGAYTLEIAPAPSYVITRRDFIFGDVLVLPKDYPNLRTFYSQIESKDQENIILKAAAPTTASNTSPSPAH